MPKFNLWKVAEGLIAAGANVQSCDNPGAFPPIHLAAERGSSPCIDVLVAHGADINRRAYGDHIDVVEAPTKNGASIDETTPDVGTALHAAAINGKHQTVEALLNLGASIRERGGRMASVLRAACYGGSKETIRTVLDNLHIDENVDTIKKRVQEVGDEECWNLLEAARRNVLRKIQEFADQNPVNGDARFWFSGETAIIAAASQGHHKPVELLVKKGANMQSRDRTGARAIHVAARRGDMGMIEMLLRNRPQMNIRNDAYETAEDLAEHSGYPHVAGLLTNW